MARGDQLSRQWKIIQALNSSHQGKSATRLAAELDCHSRTVYRDLEALQAAGFPLFTEKRDGKTCWSMLEAGRNQPPIPLNLTELMALHFSRNLLKSLDGTFIYDSLESLFDKVKSTLSQPYLDYLEKAEQTIGAGARKRNPNKDFQSILTRVHQAVRERRLIDILYFTMSRRAMGRRRISPYQVWFYDETFYVIGHCHSRQSVRVFALDRIQDITLLDETFVPPQNFDARLFMGNSFGIFQGKPVTVTIRFCSDVAGYIREKVWHPSQKLEDQPDGSLVFTAEVAGLEEIKFWVLKWGSAATVLAPPSLREAVCREARALYEQHKENSDP
jgi:predicted DNA-binding transcriptional regulator YafY